MSRVYIRTSWSIAKPWGEFILNPAKQERLKINSKFIQLNFSSFILVSTLLKFQTYSLSHHCSPLSLRPADLLTSKPLSPSYPSPLNPLIFISLSSQPPFSILSISSQPPSISRPSPFNPSLLPIHLLSTPLSSPSHPSPLNPPLLPVYIFSEPSSSSHPSPLNPTLLQSISSQLLSLGRPCINSHVSCTPGHPVFIHLSLFWYTAPSYYSAPVSLYPGTPWSLRGLPLFLH